MKKITAIVHDLSSNPIVRSHSILQSLISIGFEIEVVGFLINNKKLFQPYSKFYNYKYIHIGPNPSIFKIIYNSYKLFKQCKGDYIYIFKPLPTTCITGFFYSFFSKKKIICCDSEDNEIDINFNKLNDFLKSFWSVKYNFIFYFYFKFKKNVTVANKELKKKLNGEVIYHGPAIVSKSIKKNKRKENESINIFFGGTPRSFKGIEILTKLINEKEFENFFLTTAGPNYENFYSKYNAIKNYNYLGIVNNDQISSIMEGVDIVIIPSQINSFTKYQTPAKLLEAMAYSKIIITTDLPAMREILGADRGIILKDFNLQNLKKILLKIKANKIFYSKIADNGHEFFKKHASINANAKKLNRILSNIEK